MTTSLVFGLILFGIIIACCGFALGGFYEHLSQEHRVQLLRDECDRLGDACSDLSREVAESRPSQPTPSPWPPPGFEQAWRRRGAAR